MLGRRSMIGLLSIVVAFLVALHVQWSPASFGLYRDDSLYLSSARALATGEGYVIPSIPGEPAQTKYPIFYPWLLSLLWRVWPTFPDNLYGAFWLSLLWPRAPFFWARSLYSDSWVPAKKRLWR